MDLVGLVDLVDLVNLVNSVGLMDLVGLISGLMLQGGYEILAMNLMSLAPCHLMNIHSLAMNLMGLA